MEKEHILIAAALLVCALLAAGSAVSYRHSPGCRLQKYEEAFPISYQVTTKTKFDSDGSSFRTILGLCRWKEKKYGEITAKYRYFEGSPLMEYLGIIPYEKYKKEIDAAITEETAALEKSFSTELNSIIDHSSVLVQSKREQITEALAGTRYRKVLSAADSFAEKEYEKGYTEAMKSGVGSIEVSMLYTAYPKSMIAGCRQDLRRAESSGDPDVLSRAIVQAAEFRSWFRFQDDGVERAKEALAVMKREKAAAEEREREKRNQQYRKIKAESDRRRANQNTSEPEDDYYYAHDLDGFLDDLGDEFEDEDEAIDAWEDRED